MINEKDKIRTSKDVSIDAAGRGIWDTYQQGYLDAMRDFIRLQNPHYEFYWDSEVALAEDDILNMTSGLTPTLNVGGAIPDKNGFIEGYGVTLWDTLTAGTGMSFRVYRNGVATECVFLITSEFNDALGNIHARIFNINPQSHVAQTDRDVYQFKAGERIALRAEAPVHPSYTETDDITQAHIFLYYTFNVITPDTLESQTLAGGSPGGGGTGDGSGIPGSAGNPGTPPIVA